MNERIKQLALEAGDYVNEVYTAPVRSKTPGKIWEDGHIDWHTQFNEKFAELILIEVTDILSTYRGKVVFEDGAEYNYEHPIIAIRKHFGVEE